MNEWMRISLYGLRLYDPVYHRIHCEEPCAWSLGFQFLGVIHRNTTSVTSNFFIQFNSQYNVYILHPLIQFDHLTLKGIPTLTYNLFPNSLTHQIYYDLKTIVFRYHNSKILHQLFLLIQGFVQYLRAATAVKRNGQFDIL